MSIQVHIKSLKGLKMHAVKIYTNYGYFQYDVPEIASAIEHAQLIMERGLNL